MTQDAFFVEPKKLTIRDKEILISPLQVKKLSQATIKSAPLVGLISSGKLDPQVIMAYADTVIDLCALATDLDVEWVGNLNTAELIALLKEVISVNMDFIVLRVIPQVSSMMKELGESARSLTTSMET